MSAPKEVELEREAEKLGHLTIARKEAYVAGALAERERLKRDISRMAYIEDCQRQEISALKARNAEWNECASKLWKTIKDQAAQLQAAREGLERAEEAFSEYGAHDDNCASWDCERPAECTCGYSTEYAAIVDRIAALQPAKAERGSE